MTATAPPASPTTCRWCARSCSGAARGTARFGIAVLVIGAVLAAIGLAPQAVLEFTSFSQ